jgi:hypothetical protein
MPEPFRSTAIRITDQHPQLGTLHYTAVVTIPLTVPTESINRVVIRACRLLHNRTVELTQEDI